MKVNGSPWTEKYSWSCTLKQFWKTLTTKDDEANFNIRRTSHYVGILPWDSPSLFSIFSWGISVLSLGADIGVKLSVAQDSVITKQKKFNQIALKWRFAHKSTFKNSCTFLKHIQNHFSLRQQDLHVSVTAKRTLPSQISLLIEIKHIIASTNAK